MRSWINLKIINVNHAIQIQKISPARWDFDQSLIFFKGHGLQEIIELCMNDLKPRGDLYSDFYKIKANFPGEIIGEFGPVEPALAQAIDTLGLRTAKGDMLGYESTEMSYSPHVEGVLDCMKWDALGKREKKSVAELTAIGSRVNASKCYASLISVDIDGKNLSSIASRIRDLNFWGQKWSLPDGPAGGKKGLINNIKRVEKVRNAVGSLPRIMFELHGEWNAGYLEKFIAQVEDFNITWLEDPFPVSSTQDYFSYPNKKTPICVGEKLVGPLNFKSLINAKGNFIIHADIVSCGGYTAANNIKNDCIAHDRLMTLHGRRLLVAFHLAAYAPTDFEIVLEYNPIFEPERQVLMGIRNKLIPNENDGCLNFHAVEREGLWELERL